MQPERNTIIQTNTTSFENHSFHMHRTIPEPLYEHISTQIHIRNFTFNVRIITHIRRYNMSQIAEFLNSLNQLPIYTELRKGIRCDP